MNLLLFPMWLLSGALFPPSGASTWVGWVMKVNPLTYELAAVRHLLDPRSPMLELGFPSLPLSVLVTVLFSLGIFLVSFLVVQQR
jgi:ABC-2 type transport system permease protein